MVEKTKIVMNNGKEQVENRKKQWENAKEIFKNTKNGRKMLKMAEWWENTNKWCMKKALLTSLNRIYY